MPGGDPGLACRVVVQETPDLPYLPELPNRGAGADMLGRGLALMSRVSQDFGADTSPGGWRLAPAGQAMRRAESYLGNDMDALAEEFASYEGPLTVTLVGPWTLVAGVEDRRGQRLLGDPGLVREVAAALAVTAADLVALLARAVPRARPRLQIDEPALDAVLRGRVPTPSGYRRYDAVSAAPAAALLTEVAESARSAGADVWLHSCAPLDFDVLAAVALDGLSFDAARHRPVNDEGLGSWLESGRGITFGVWPTDRAEQAGDRTRAEALVVEPLQRLGLQAHGLPGPAQLSPRCGLAAAPPESVPATFRVLRALARHLGQE